MKSVTLSKIVFTLAVIVAVFTRFLGNNWDSGFHLHPDERFLTMVGMGISLPSNLLHLFSTPVSSMNPHNVGFDFYVYGTFPLFFVRGVASLLSQVDYYKLTQIGRTISGVLDIGTLILVYLTSLRIFRDRLKASFSALFYSTLVLPIQLSHFFSVDTFLTFFLLLSNYFLLKSIQLIRGFCVNSALLGFVWGLALSSKYSAALFFPVILLGFFVRLIHRHGFWHTVLAFGIFAVTAFISFRIFQPFFFAGLFSPNPEVIADLRMLKSFEDITGWFPPAVQWITPPRIIFPLVNLFWWGIGPLQSLTFMISAYLLVRQRKNIPELIPVIFWIFWLTIYVGTGFSMTGRYFYPALPFVAVISGVGLDRLLHLSRSFLTLFLATCLLLPLAYMSIYILPHTRVQASSWIRSNIPRGSTLSCDEWDDCLPLDAGADYKIVQLNMYSRDSKTKLIELEKQLSDIDYLVISSNRVFASITSAPKLYPLSSDFYHRLFSGHAGFDLVSQFHSRPNLPIPWFRLCLRPLSLEYGSVASAAVSCLKPGITFIDDFAEEAYTVYDHPSVFIFKRSTASSTDAQLSPDRK